MFAGIISFLRLFRTGLGLTALAMVGVLGAADLKGVVGQLDPQLAPSHALVSSPLQQRVAVSGRVRCEIRPNWKMQKSPAELELMCLDRPRVP